MKFDPYSFLRLAAASGIEIKRYRSKILVTFRGELPDEWRDSIKLHKPELIRVIPAADLPKRKKKAASAAESGWYQRDIFDSAGPP